jgi:hypothetical protein
MRYYSPELLRYIKGDDSVRGTDLTTQSDVFALGLLFHALFCGDDLPETGRPGYVADAVIDHVTPRLSPKLPAPLRPAVRAMLHREPARRPSVVEIIDRFSGIDLSPGVPEGPEWITEFATASGMPRPPVAPASAYNPVKTPPVAPRPTADRVDPESTTGRGEPFVAPPTVTSAVPTVDSGAPPTVPSDTDRHESVRPVRVPPIAAPASVTRVVPVPVAPRPAPEPPPASSPVSTEPVTPAMPTSPRLRMNFGRPPTRPDPTDGPEVPASPPPPPPPPPATADARSDDDTD